MPPLIATSRQTNARTLLGDAKEGGVGLTIFESAKVRWLNAEEIIALLSCENSGSSTGFALRPSTSPPSTPPTSGTLLLYDRSEVRNYKSDGHCWVKKRNCPKKVREDHVKLRFRGQQRVSGTYVHSETVSTMHRRAYRLISTDNQDDDAMPVGQGGSSNDDLVLVHYLDTDEAMRESASYRDQLSAATTTFGKSRKKRKIGEGGGTSPRKLRREASVACRKHECTSRKDYIAPAETTFVSSSKGGVGGCLGREEPFNEGALDILWDMIGGDLENTIQAAASVDW